MGRSEKELNDLREIGKMWKVEESVELEKKLCEGED